MPVVLNFTLNPLQSWLSYRSKDNKASESDYVEQTLTNETSPHHGAGVATKPSARARVEVVSTSDTSAPTTPSTPREQVALAARLRQDVLFSAAATSDRNDDEEG